MKRYELIRLLVLVDISDDYEEPAHIYQNIAERAGILGITVRPQDVDGALADLTESGLAKAYKLSTRAPATEIQGVPPLGRFQDYYFWITEKGKAVVDSTRDEQYPFDDEGGILPGWSPPAE